MKIVFLLSIITAYVAAWKSVAPGEGPFAHLSNEEFAAQYLMPIEENTECPQPELSRVQFENKFGPNSNFDWRNTSLSHCVGDIRNQGHCGSCWAHATTEFMSDRYCIQVNGTQTINFAPQAMVDCANSTWEASGCDGAETQTILRGIENFGLVNESCYPYFSGDNGTVGKCHESTCLTDQYRVLYEAEKGSVQLYFNCSNEAMAEDIFENGPIYFSMVVFADFKNYSSGVYVNKTSEVLGTHAVKCLGWGFDAGINDYYWVCANSWSPSFGENGFFRIKFNTSIGYKAGSLRNARHTTVTQKFLKSVS